MGTTADKLQKLSQTKSAIKTAIEAKGVTVGDVKFADYPSKIGEIIGGEKKKFGIGIDNLVGDVDSAGWYVAPTSQFGVVLNGVRGGNFNNMFTSNTSLTSFSAPDLLEIKRQSLDSRSIIFNHTFDGCSKLVSVDFGNVLSVGVHSYYGGQLDYAFQNCNKLSAVDFSKVEYAGTYAFYSSFMYCYGLSSDANSISFPSLKKITGSNPFYQTFWGCDSISSFTFDSLEEISAEYAFYSTFRAQQPSDRYVRGLREIYFPELTSIVAYTSPTFQQWDASSYKTKVYFPKLQHIERQSGAAQIFRSCSQINEVHFGAEHEAYITSHPDWPSLFGLGAGTATVYFDV